MVSVRLTVTRDESDSKTADVRIQTSHTWLVMISLQLRTVIALFSTPLQLYRYCHDARLRSLSHLSLPNASHYQRHSECVSSGPDGLSQSPPRMRSGTHAAVHA